MNIQLVFDAAVIAAMLWFWARRARPMLLTTRAEPLALRLGLAATALGVAAMALHFATVALGGDETLGSAVRLIGGFVWVVIVGLGYPEYRFLRHATGTKRP